MKSCSAVPCLRRLCEVLAVCFYDMAVKQHYCNSQESIIVIAWDERSKTRKPLEEAFVTVDVFLS